MITRVELDAALDKAYEHDTEHLFSVLEPDDAREFSLHVADDIFQGGSTCTMARDDLASLVVAMLYVGAIAQSKANE